MQKERRLFRGAKSRDRMADVTTNSVASKACHSVGGDRDGTFEYDRLFVVAICQGLSMDLGAII